MLKVDLFEIVLNHQHADLHHEDFVLLSDDSRSHFNLETDVYLRKRGGELGERVVGVSGRELR